MSACEISVQNLCANNYLSLFFSFFFKSSNSKNQTANTTPYKSNIRCWRSEAQNTHRYTHLSSGFLLPFNTDILIFNLSSSYPNRQILPGLCPFFVVFDVMFVTRAFLQNQHEDLKRQYYDLHEQHQVQGKDHSRLLDEHKERYDKLQEAKEIEVSQLKGNALCQVSANKHWMKQCEYECKKVSFYY